MIRRTRSGFAYIRWDITGVVWACTDPTLLEAVLAELAQMDPGCEVHKEQPRHTFVAPYICSVSIPFERDKHGRPKGDYEHREVAWWIMMQLCERGWEPFDASGVSAFGPKEIDGSHAIRRNGHFFLRLVGRAD